MGGWVGGVGWVGGLQGQGKDWGQIVGAVGDCHSRLKRLDHISCPTHQFSSSLSCSPHVLLVVDIIGRLLDVQ